MSKTPRGDALLYQLVMALLILANKILIGISRSWDTSDWVFMFVAALMTLGTPASAVSL